MSGLVMSGAQRAGQLGGGLRRKAEDVTGRNWSPVLVPAPGATQRAGWGRPDEEYRDTWP